MRRFLNTVSYVLAAVAVIYGVLDGLRSSPEIEPRRPAVPQTLPAPAPTPAPTPVPRGGVDVVTIDVGERENAIGTGFAVSDGWWLTARHVVDGCDVTGLATGPRDGVKALEVDVHPNADLALLRIPGSRPLFPLATSPVRENQDGFSMGYPQDQPGAVHVRAMGRLRMHSVGRYDIEEPVIAWAERQRTPASLPALAGLSGGPMFDATGAVVGVLVAESKRRGRVVTTTQASIRALLSAHAVMPRLGAGDLALGAGNYTAVGDSLRQDLRIAKVVCRVNGPSRRPGR